MGAYLSQPKTDKISKEEFNDYVTVGSSSMQGWRNSQEDAHNVILDFDSNTSFFAVYDGHGGAEVATYCADRMPQFLRDLKHYIHDDMETALKQAFLQFDRTLLEPSVVEILKILAGEKNFEDSDGAEEEDDGEDLAELHEESRLPLPELMEKYKGHPSLAVLSKLKEVCSNNGSKPQSPYLRGRRTAAIVAEATNKAIVDPDSKPEGTSTSAAALAALADGPCSSKAASSSSASADLPKMDTEDLEEDSTVTSSSSGSKSGNNTGTPDRESESTEAEASQGTSNGANHDQSVKQKEQNGCVTSTDAKPALTSNVGGHITSTGAPENESAVSASADDLKQNGAVGSSSSGSSGVAKADGGISSTSKGGRRSNKAGPKLDDDDSTDDDYHVENIEEHEKADSSGEEGIEDEEDEDGEMEQEDSEYDSEPGTDEYEEEDEDDVESALANEQFCANMIEEPGKDSGCTAVVALLKGRDLYVANAGDSRCVVCRNGKAIEMSLDHKPEDDEECARIINAGGRVTVDGRVNGGLNLSRAIGDHAYKMNSSLSAEEQMISALPDIKKLIIQPEDEFMVLACDGIWNYMSSDEVVDFVRKRLQDETKTMSKICEELFDLCLAPDTLGDGTGCDNMTAVIVRFKPKILDLETSIDPTDTEDALLAKKAAVAKNNGQQEQTKGLKRLAMPALNDGDEDFNEAEQANKTKRLKTDYDGCENEKRNQNHSLPTSSSNNEMGNASKLAEGREQECDSVSSDAAEALKAKCTTENATQPEATAAAAIAVSASSTATPAVVSST